MTKTSQATAGMEKTVSMGKDEPAGKPSTPRPAKAARAGNFSINQILCWAAIGISGLMGLVFLLDIATGMVLNGASTTLDVFGLLAAGVIIYVGIDTLRELR